MATLEVGKHLISKQNYEKSLSRFLILGKWLRALQFSLEALTYGTTPPLLYKGLLEQADN